MADAKLKMLRIIDIIRETDSQTPLTAPDICKKLQLYGIDAERKSVCRDLNLLADAGYQIRLCKDKRKGYYMDRHEFSDWELKVLIDAVWQARFLTEEDTKDLADRLISHASRREQAVLKRFIPIKAKQKTGIAETKQIIAALMEAIDKGKKVSFTYTYIDQEKKPHRKRGGYRYTVSPYTLVWQTENYYMVSNVEKYDNLNYFRLDRMRDFMIGAEPLRKAEEFLGANADMKIQEFVNTSIYQYGGDRIRLKLECRKDMINSLYDRYGDDIRLRKLEDGRLEAVITVQKGEGLYQWLMQCGSRIKVVAPEEVRKEYLWHLTNTLNQYASPS